MQTGYRHYLSECAKRAGSEVIQSLNSDLLYQSFYKTTDKPMVLKVSSQAGQKQKSTPLHSFKGLPISIDPTKPPKNYKDAMSRPDAEEWAQAYMEEYNNAVPKVNPKPTPYTNTIPEILNLDPIIMMGIY